MNTQITNPLANRALLVSVTISQWSGRKIDKRATDTANQAHKASSAAGNYHKKLLPAAIELEKIAALASHTRKFVNEQTLPWMTDGTRIISGKNYLNFQNEMRKIKSEFDQAVSEFCLAYPTLRQDAVNKLGDLYSPTEYPDDIADRFGISVDFFPMPSSSDFRIALASNEKTEFENKLKAIENKAMKDACNRLFEVVKIATDRLKDPNATFRDSLMTNISDIANLMPSLNISDDASLEQLANDAKNLVQSIEPKKLRSDSKLRDETRKQLSDIESKMAAFMGVAS